MKILSFDTSIGRNLNLAVSANSEIILKERSDNVDDLAEEIVPAIKQILKRAKLPLSAIDGFAINIGPGSFTGLRIGLSAVKALSLATGKPVVGVSALDILAFGLDSKGQICAIIDAKRNNIYACFYDKRNAKFRKTTAYTLTTIDCLLRRIKKNTLFVGDALYLYQDKIRQKKGLCFFAEENLWLARIENLAEIASMRFQKKSFDDAKSILPIYLYPKECQVRRK